MKKLLILLTALILAGCGGGEAEEKCEEGEKRKSIESCGENDRGYYIEKCQDGEWQVTSFCDDPDECRDGETSETVCGTETYYETTLEKTMEIVCTRGKWVEDSDCSLEDGWYSDHYASWGTLECVGDDAYLDGKKFTCELCWEIAPDGAQCERRSGNVADNVYKCGELEC